MFSKTKIAVLPKLKRRNKSPWYIRLAGEIVCRHLANTGVRSFQCYGEKNWDYEGKGVDVQVPTEDVISCVIGTTGEGISSANAREKYKIGTFVENDPYKGVQVSIGIVLPDEAERMLKEMKEHVYKEE